MIAKIGRGENIIGALEYNQLKVDAENGAVLFTNKMVESIDGSFSLAQLKRSFDPYIMANMKTEKPVLHISLNPDPRDKVSDEQFIEMAQKYMEHMGYGDQPYVVFKHTDIDRSHIHIVSVCINEHGKKIADTYERRRSMDICRSLEQDYGLYPATEKKLKTDERKLRTVDYRKGDIKSQIASIVRYLPDHYQFQGLGTYNALLKLHNITAEEVIAEKDGQPRQGLVYFALDEHGGKASNPFKASLFGKKAGYAQLQAHYTASKGALKDSPIRPVIKRTIEATLRITDSEAGFVQQLSEQDIDTVIRRSVEGRIYGISFIDHSSGGVWNGSQFGKELSANVFNERWTNTGEKDSSDIQNCPSLNKSHDLQNAIILPDIFDNTGLAAQFVVGDDHFLVEGLGGWLPEPIGDSPEEAEFARNIKKKKRRRRRHRD